MQNATVAAAAIVAVSCSDAEGRAKGVASRDHWLYLFWVWRMLL